MTVAYRIAFAVIVVVAVIGSAFAFVTLHRIDTNSRDTAAFTKATQCSDRLLADFGGAVGLALNAPPAPNPKRDAASSFILLTANRLSHSNVICVHGIPAPLTPPAILTAR